MQELAKKYGIKLYDDKFVIYKNKRSGNYSVEYKKRWDYDHVDEELWFLVENNVFIKEKK